MKYSKPEVSFLGDAGKVIQGTKDFPGMLDSVDQLWDFNPAYDLDE